MKPLYESVKKENKLDAIELLGYTKKYEIEKDKVFTIGYTQQKDLEKAEDCEIQFLVPANNVMLRTWVSMQELKAINQKCKDLGWLDE